MARSLGARGASWGLPKAPGRFQGPRDTQGERGASWELAGGFLRPQEGSKDPGLVRGRGEQAGSKESELRAS